MHRGRIVHHTWHYSVVFSNSNLVSGFPKNCSFHVRLSLRLKKRTWGKNGRKRQRKTLQQLKRKVHFASKIKTEFFWSSHTSWIDQDISNECNTASVYKCSYHVKWQTSSRVVLPNLYSEWELGESEHFHFFLFRLMQWKLDCQSRKQSGSTNQSQGPKSNNLAFTGSEATKS